MNESVSLCQFEIPEYWVISDPKLESMTVQVTFLESQWCLNFTNENHYEGGFS